MIKKFEDLEVWQVSMELAKAVFQTFRDCRDYALRDQIQRAVISIPSNIAEGFERNTNKEFIQFLFIAKGSCGELRTLLTLAQQFQLISTEVVSNLLDTCLRISKMLSSLIKTRKEKY